jgi:outer membrane protein assembly factor BamB
MLGAFAAVSLLPGCAVSHRTENASLPVRHASWATYQHSPDRNAVFERYAIPHDWSYDSAANINGGLALVGDTLLFTSFSQRLVALDVRTGHELWHAQLPNIAMTTPIVAGGMVYVGTGRNGVLKRNLIQRIRFFRKDVWGIPGGDEIAAFDLRTGAPRWTYHTVGEDMPSAVYDAGRLIFANGDWHAYALRADNGKELWSTDVGGAATMANAVMADGAVIFGVCAPHVGQERSDTVAVDPSTGKILWRSSYGHCDATPSYARGKVFVNDVLPGDMALRKKTVVAALNARTGKPVWAYREKSRGLWSIIGSDEVAVAGTYASGTYYQPAPLDDEVLAFDAETGKIRWRFHTSGPTKMSPVVKDGRLYIGDAAGMLYTIDTRNGRLLEIREFKKPFSVSPPIIAGDKLVVVNGTSVDAIPLSGRPDISERVGWGIVSDAQETASP